MPFTPIKDATLTGFLGRKWQGWTLKVEKASTNLDSLGRALVLLCTKLGSCIDVTEARGIRKFEQKRVTITGTLTGKPYSPDEPNSYELTLHPEKLTIPKPPKQKKERKKHTKKGERNHADSE
jgi:hypothetical protein